MSETILIADDDPVQQHMLQHVLSKKFGYHVRLATNGRAALEQVQSSDCNDIHAVLLDIAMPVMDGFAALKAIREHRPDLPVLMLTGNDDTSIAVKAIKNGANDFILKPFDPAHLDVAIRNALKMSSLARELARVRRAQTGALGFSDLMGHASGLKDAVLYGRKAALSDVPVLIAGETGVGKELFARAIHGESKRAGAPFIAINCGAIPENLVESTLFGHEKGAFTGATMRNLGKFREAEGGTIFLDEIGELPFDAQVKLLRVLQQKEVEPVGAARSVKVNVRVISATNRDLKREVKAGRFREDLFFRLHVLAITVPPLRERSQDILMLAQHFLTQFAATESLAAKPLSADAKSYLLSCAWPGNVRELENVMHRALVLSQNDTITRADFEWLHDAPQPIAVASGDGMSIHIQRADGGFKSMQEIEEEAIALALMHARNNVAKAADMLRIARSTFYRKIKEARRV